MSNVESWRSWQGRLVEGKFPLRQWLGGSDHSAVFLTETAAQGSEQAAIKLIEVEAADAERQLEHLRQTTRLSHPHLIRTFAAGRDQIEGAWFVYVVMERADEDLAEILPQRPLDAGEVSNLLPPLLDALAYIHGQGLVHGRVKPANILAVGDELKLSSDQVIPAGTIVRRKKRDAYDAPETESGPVSAASDVWSIGVTLVEALTQSPAFAERIGSGESGGSDRIPEPFGAVVRECLQADPMRRCSLAQIQARFVPAARSVPAPAEPEPGPPARTRRGPALAIAAAVVLLVLIGFGFVHSRGKNATGSAAETAETAPADAATVAPAPERTPPQPPAAHPTASAAAVARQVMPDVPKHAQNTIRGTIKVAVEVDVDSSGKVTSAKFKTRGSSPYFAERALQAAKNWEFSPPVVEGQTTASVWLVQFRFRRGSIQASSQQVKR
jgi:eukaryotic-like serine/threonine-protein kinase